MNFRQANEPELTAVSALYDTARAEPYSVWNEAYPVLDDALHDFETGNLYVLTDACDRVIGALSVVPENETDDLSCWQITGEGVREIARVVIAPDCHGHGYARLMMESICTILRARGERAVHISVAEENLPAMKTYPRTGFLPVGEADLFGGHYVLMEKDLSLP